MLNDAEDIAAQIANRLSRDIDDLTAAFGPPDPHRVRWCAIDDVLPESFAEEAFHDLPALPEMVRRADDKERKYVTANIDKLNETVRRLVIALNSPKIANVVARIMGKRELQTDTLLYNGGVTVMAPGDFMRPHLDNSHDFNRSRRREVVLLFYISPHWEDRYGGALSVWPNARKNGPTPIAFRPNRLVIMETTDDSWHSVDPIIGPMPRANVIAYYYASPADKSPVRLTHFAAWPNEPIRNALFQAEFHMRNFVARLGVRRPTKNKHVYEAASTTAM
ncbi:MAG: 2OG-Fe(II) oxygenase [Caulobacterales bacterium]